MPITGRKLKSDNEKRTRVKPQYEWVEIQHIPFEGAPEMPKGRWKQATRRWWEVISRMPHCVLWDESDWQFAMDTMKVHKAFIDGENANAAVELRQREKIMGTTLDARRDLRIRYVETTPEEERLGVTAIEDYKKRLTK